MRRIICSCTSGGQARADAVAVNLVGVEAFGLEEDVVALLVGEADDFVFDARAIARPVDAICRSTWGRDGGWRG
jgi:hypothetical protein